MRVGICGYPGSGKSTVFSALAPGGASAKSGVTYGNIKVPDARVDRLAAVFSPKKKVYAEITFVDVGGGGGATGAFPPDVLQHMRNADVLVHVVRVFDNPMIAESTDPSRDEQRFAEELVLIDHSVLERRLERFRKEVKKGREVDVTKRCVAHLEEGLPLRTLDLSDDDLGTLTGIQLLSAVPLITLYNLSEDAWEDDSNAALKETGAKEDGSTGMAMCASIEAEIAELDEEEQAEMLEGMGLGEPARNGFVRAAYGCLDLISMLTAGPDECRAWPIRRGVNAKKAAGRIHSDIERGFIRVEVYRVDELEAAGSEAELKKQGKLRVEGRDYTVVDGDVCNFRFNV